MTVAEMVARADRYLLREGDVKTNALEAQAWIARAALEVQRIALSATIRGAAAPVAGQLETVIRNTVLLNTLVVPRALSGDGLVVNCLTVGGDPRLNELKRVLLAWEWSESFRGAGWHVEFMFLGAAADGAAADGRGKRCSDVSLPHAYRYNEGDDANGPFLGFPFCISCGYVPPHGAI